MGRISSVIKFHKPKRLSNCFWPVGHKMSPAKLVEYRQATQVKKGQLLGYSGCSGLGWGCSDYPPTKENIRKYISWDEPHLHFEVFIRAGSKGKKKYFDPYGIKEQSSFYPDSSRFQNRGNMGRKGDILWMLDKEGMPKCIK